MLKMRILCMVLVLMYTCSLSAQVCHSFEASTEEIHSHRKLSTDSIGLAPTDNYDIVYHRISVWVDPAVRYIRGTVVSYFKPLSPLSQIAFDLTDTLSVDSVYYRGVSIHTFAHTGNAITISFGDTITSLDSVTVYYSGVPPTTGFGSFVTDFHDSIPILWTLSEPYGSRDWWPGKMTLTDKVDSLDFYINVPVGNRAASNGLLADTARIGNTVTYHWRHRYPIANYLIAMGVTNYYAYSDTVHTTHGNIYVLNYVFPEDTDGWHSEDSNINKALTLYSNLFGQYPFIKEKYGHAQFGWGGGMEHQTMSFVYNWSYDLINHEMAHQWFGDKLTCGSWSDIWLNEGFAVYLSGLCYEYLAPEWWWPFRYQTSTNVIKHANEGSVFCGDTNRVRRIFDSNLSYRKGAYILHMLRGQLGDSAFFAALYDYANDSTLVYSFSKTALLKQHLETHSGKDLTTFFTNWFYGVGYPSYAMEWVQEGGHVSCRLSQSTSDPSVSFYAMHVPVKFLGNNRDTTVILDHTSSGQEFSFAVPFAVDSVQIDPELWLISAHNVVRRMPVLQDDFIAIYPNPVSDMMTIWYDSKNLHQVSYAIWDMQGQKVMQNNIPMSGDRYAVSLAGLQGGVYIIKVNTEQGSRSQRIVKY
jgi:aminopeptidase N